MINWKITKKDLALIEKIVNRAIEMEIVISDDRQHHTMNLKACHLNGCKLDLEGLLNAPSFDFVHDILGIDRHINRDTGKIERFCPRLYLSKARKERIKKEKNSA